MNSSVDAGLWTDYYQVCLVHPGAVRRVERLLAESGSALLTAREASDALGGEGPTYDQVARVLGALSTAGVLKPSPDGAFVIDTDRYSTSIAWRSAALEALSWAGAAPNELGECELLVATPADARSVVAEAYQRQFSDLRTTIRTIVAAAKHRVLLAAPYWDVQVASDLAEILRRRKDAGVTVAILARQPHVGSTNERALAVLRDALPESSSCQIRILEHRSPDDPFGWSTFHFKAACADGMHAYLGSANFNTAGLSSRWELGVKLGGRRARTIAELLEALFAASRPF